jgi:ubiquinone biosynthesis protein UbiJ
LASLAASVWVAASAGEVVALTMGKVVHGGAWFLKVQLRRGGQHVATQLRRAADNRRTFIGTAVAIGLVARRLPLTASVRRLPEWLA